MILRWLAREVREFPATSLFCLTWIIVFAAMTYESLAAGAPLAASRWLLFGFGGGESFGDVSLGDLARGQVWRLVTCNFVHYSLVHLGLNLLAMYQLGGLLESWYGSYQFIFIYGLTGGGGNLISALVRRWLRSSPEVHAAGGSVVIMGMIGLCAVAGWQGRIPDGRRLSRLMLLFIILTAGLGAAYPHRIDNWGHAGGLVVGAAIGFAHPRLVAAVGKPSAWGSGVLTLLIMIGCGAAQFVADRRDAPARLERTLVLRTNYLARATRELALLRRPDDPPFRVALASKWLGVLEEILVGDARRDLDAMRPLVAAAETRPLDDGERRRLDEHLTRVLDAMRRQYEDDRRRLHRLRGAR
jgi:membrane associated rhomboid family serine protease